MWNRDESKHDNVVQAHRAPAAPAPQTLPTDVKEPRVATLGSSVFVKGGLVASEDLTVDGRVEGRIELPDHTLTIGPNANVKADIVAKTLIVFGTVLGTVTARDRIDIRRGATVEGEISCTRIGIQDGASFSGRVTMGKRRGKPNGADAEDSAPVLAAAV
jgi:cytoskeletal protein CcmA (bactofilin family)